MRLGGDLGRMLSGENGRGLEAGSAGTGCAPGGTPEGGRSRAAEAEVGRDVEREGAAADAEVGRLGGGGGGWRSRSDDGTGGAPSARDVRSGSGESGGDESGGGDASGGGDGASDDPPSDGSNGSV